MTYRLALDVGATRTMLALVERDRPEIVAHERPTTEVLFTGHRPPGLALAGAIQHFLRFAQVDIREIVGVGVGIPGLVDRDRGVVISCPNLHVLDGAALAPEASRELGIPIYIENNTNLISVGEHTAGLGQGVNDLAVIFVGSGVGCGLILDGKLYEGADGAAGEFGHTIVVPEGRLCTCGARGCLEMYCSGKALAQEACSLFGPRELFTLGTRFAGAELLVEQAKTGHAKATEVLKQSFGYLGIGLTNLVNMLNPRLVVLGGSIVFGWPQGADIARDVVMRTALPGARRNLRIEISELRHFAGVLGGAALVSSYCRS